MRVVIALFVLLFATLPFGGEADAAAEGKRVALLGTTNSQSLHRRLDLDLHQVRHPGRHEGDQLQLQL